MIQLSDEECEALSIKYQSRLVGWPSQPSANIAIILTITPISVTTFNKDLQTTWMIRPCLRLRLTTSRTNHVCCNFSQQDSKSVIARDLSFMSSLPLALMTLTLQFNWNCLHLPDGRQDTSSEDSSRRTGNVIVDRSLSKYVVRELPSIADISLSFCSAHLTKIIRN